MRILLLSLFTFLFFHLATAQSLTPQVVATGGNFATSGNYSLSYTVGEAVTPTFSATGYILTQGFQQNNVSSTSVQEVSFDNVTVKIYPNPASDFANVLITSDQDISHTTVKFFDLLGREINVPVTNTSDGKNQHTFTLNLSSLAAAMYFIAIYDSANNTSHTFKLNKINF